MILLGLNIDHCATLRQARYRESGRVAGGNVEPDPVTLGLLAERAGADGITIHLREDHRHIQERDVWRLRETIATRLNLEMACTPAMTEFAVNLRPDSVCLVPENRREVTTEGGLDVAGNEDRVRAVVDTMRAAGIVTSLFICDSSKKNIPGQGDPFGAGFQESCQQHGYTAFHIQSAATPQEAVHDLSFKGWVSPFLACGSNHIHMAVEQ